jgi:3',5'-cyclic AMP phosphodiesterase CpdA
VSDDEAVVFDQGVPRRYDELAPATEYAFDGFEFRTLPRPGELLCRFATVNDLHFGETVCGLMDGVDLGPVFESAPGEDPYPEVMNRGAVAEMGAMDPAAVLVKGDLTSHGAEDELRQCLSAYQPVFGDGLHVIPGNHDAAIVDRFPTPMPYLVELPGVRLAMIDTSEPMRASGRVTATTLEWLDDTAAPVDDRPLLVFGHHQAWNPGSPDRNEDYFGINPEDSIRLVDVVARRPGITGYFAGHTHRNRVRQFGPTGSTPWVEVACVKDYPGTWAEYRVFDGGVLQIHRRIASTEALVWSEKTRGMFGGLYADYAFGSLADRCFPILSP